MAKLDKYRKLVEEISTVGIDIDHKETKKLIPLIKRMENFGVVTARQSKKGWHYKIRLPEPITLARSFEIRYYCGDDYHRLVRDMLKTLANCRTIDVLFDRKEIYNKSILEMAEFDGNAKGFENYA